jgi:ATP-dependent exoDNAse (exonuclease V) beta subunit
MLEPKLKILKASAGSGKTYQLVVEYLKLTLLTKDPTVYKRINAMTFTNKASLEMKERILEALIILSAPKEGKHFDQGFLSNKSKELGIPEAIIQERSADVLNRILHYYGEFNIQTLDSFTTKVVRTFANDISVSQDFEVELDGENLAMNVVERLMESIGSDTEITNLLQKYTESNSEDEKNWDISKSILTFVKAITKEDINKEIEKFKDISSEQIKEITKNCRNFTKQYEMTVNQISDNTMSLFRATGFDRNLFSRKGAILNALENAKKDYFKVPFNSYDTKVNEGASWFTKGKDQDISSFENDIIEGYRKLKEHIEVNLPLYQLHSLVLKNIYNIALLKKVKETFDDIKADLNIIPMSDFNQLIQELIENEPAPFIFERLGNRFQHFLLDEFQDTSVLQWKNLIPLVENGLGENKFSLIVGDAKQAIYRWRNGEVDQFISLPKLFNPEKNPLTSQRSDFFEQMGYSDILDMNYRSKKEIVEFNNQCFQNLAGILNEEYKEVYETKSLVQKSFDQEGGGYVYCESFTKEVPNEFILKSVKDALADGYEYRDICVLTRSNRVGSTIAKYLTAESFKIASAESLWISSDKHVQFITTLFQHLLYEEDDSIKRLVAEKYLQIFPSEKSVVDIIDSHVEEIPKEKYIHKVFDLEAFFNSVNIKRDKYALNFQSLYELGEKLIMNFGFNLEQNAYLQLLLEHLFQFDQKPNATLYQFMLWYQDKGYKKSIQVSESENAIKVMTIHKSKGLQFPVVICPELGDKLQAGDSPTLIPMTEFQPELPSVLSPLNSSLLGGTTYEFVKENETQKVVLDFVNMVYVALTRSVSRSYLGFNSKNKGSQALANAISCFTSFENNVSKYGVKKQVDKTEQIDASVGLGSRYDHLWFPDISFQSDSNWNTEDEQIDFAQFGREMHLFLSKIVSEESAFDELEKLVKKGQISLANKEQIKSQFTRLLVDPEIRNLLISKGIYEQDILLPDGNSVRPDKLIIADKEATIIDFKTGKPNENHAIQMANYKAVLTQMGYNVKGYLLYTELVKLVGI